jgi:Alw26I/Eco31I/Esp3I family type II restriction m6 adenine DNA methyltransferase
VEWLIERAVSSGRTDLSWHVALWDLHEPGLRSAIYRLSALAAKAIVRIDVRTKTCDAIMEALDHDGEFDLVVTNPPWENLKPDRRELQRLSANARVAYVAALREYDVLLGMSYPLSQPERKFAGWGTNLARVGVEVALRLTAPSGVAGIVSPASLLADDSSVALRRWLLTSHTLLSAAYFPAEARQFKGVDVSTAVVVLRRTKPHRVAPRVTVFDADLLPNAAEAILHPPEFLRRTGYVVPISFGLGGIEVLLSLAHLPTFGDLERDCLWAGREIDETGIAQWLAQTGAHQFVKGRMIERFGVVEPPTLFVEKAGWRVPTSVGFERLAWRDVSRPSQKRRIIATLIPPGWVAGNSLGVAHFRDGDSVRLCALLGVMSSLVFEFQLRSFLATGHVSLGALRKVHMPDLSSGICIDHLVPAVREALQDAPNARTIVEAIAARAYGVSREQFAVIAGAFPKITIDERRELLRSYDMAAVASQATT